jgi:hypothetical protein
MASAFHGGQESLFENSAAVSGNSGLGIQTTDTKGFPGATSNEVDLNPSGWRYGQEVVAYLKSKGAKVGKLIREAEGITGGPGNGAGEVQGEYDFAALSSDGEGSPEGYSVANASTEGIEWVVPGRK